MGGFSHRNLQYIRQWYLFYNQEDIIGQQAVAQLGGDDDCSAHNPNNQGDTIWQQAVAKLQNITRFLLELGQGFAFVGEQIPLEIGDETLFVDLLFYHLELRCYVVIELKSTKFKAEHLGQLGVYISAINHQKRKLTDNPTIGLLICKDKNDVMAQYSLEASAYPIGISEYQLSQLMPEELKSQLPSIEEIESSLGGNM